MQNWEFSKSYSLIEAAFGTQQFKSAKECIRSLADRQNYAIYHFRETLRLTKAFERRHLKEGFLLEIYAEKSAWKQRKFNSYMIKASAHALASIQSIHALPDILANALYVASGQNLKSNSLLERDITLSKVVGALKADSNFRSVSLLLEKAQTGEHWQHLAALTNLSKHRSVVGVDLNEDNTGTRIPHRELYFKEFTRGEKYFPSVSVHALLGPEYLRIAMLIASVGVELNACLQKQVA